MDPRERIVGPGLLVELIPGTHILRLTRNGLPFTDVTSMIGAMDEFHAQIRAVDRSHFGLLIDTRKVPARTDPEFERAFRHFRSNLIAGFRRVAVLVETDDGFAQASAHSAESGPHVRAFRDEAQALYFLLETGEP
ncbi:MAG TPA: hypothetical protein VHE30_17175 [Polyangiaceae bacterium]|nr:hypothetical protein [Polyangiaceae bacterium]